MALQYVATLTIPKTAGTSYNISVSSAKLGWNNAILQIPILKGKNKQGLGTESEAKIVDLKKIKRTFVITGKLHASGGNSAFDRLRDLQRRLDRKPGSVSGVTPPNSGNHKLTYRGEDYIGIVLDITGDETSKSLQRATLADGSLGASKIAVKLQFFITNDPGSLL